MEVDETKLRLYPEGMKGVRLWLDGGNHFECLAILPAKSESELDGTDKVMLSAEVERLDLNTAETDVLIGRIVRSMLEHYPDLYTGGLSHICWTAALVAMRELVAERRQLAHVPKAVDLYKAVLRNTVLSVATQTDDPRYLVRAIIPSSAAEQSPNESLQDVIHYLVHIRADGEVFSPEEVLEMWEEAITHRYRSGMLLVRVIAYWRHLTVAEQSVRAYAADTIREMVLEELRRATAGYRGGKQRLSWGRSSDGVEMTGLLLDAGKEWRNGPFRVVLEEELVIALSRGYVTTVSFIIACIGKLVGLWAEGASGPTQADCLKRLMKEAISKAEIRGRFGIAAALAHHVGDIRAARCLSVRAEKRIQAIALDHALTMPLS